MSDLSELKFDQMTIKIIGDQALIESPNNNGQKVVKSIKVSTLCSAFQEKEKGVSTPMLPNGTVKYLERGNKSVLYLHSPPKKFNANVGGKIYEDCIRPGLIMIIALNSEGSGYTINDTKCYAVKDDRILLNDNTKLYGMPFPNISDDGWICWGSNSTGGKFGQLTALGMMIDRLFNSPFNNHVFHSGAFKHLGINGHHEFFAYLQNKDIFPDTMYINTTSNYRLGNV